MRFIITEQQDEIRKYLDILRDNYQNILNDLLSNPEFFEDLKDHSYNKHNYVHWWKSAKEDFYDLASRKYCGLLKDVLTKYKLWERFHKPKDYGFPNIEERRRFSCMRQFQMCIDFHFDLLRGNRYDGNDGPIENKVYYGVPDISEYFMRTFYNQ